LTPTSFRQATEDLFPLAPNLPRRFEWLQVRLQAPSQEALACHHIQPPPFHPQFFFFSSPFSLILFFYEKFFWSFSLIPVKLSLSWWFATSPPLCPCLVLIQLSQLLFSPFFLVLSSTSPSSGLREWLNFCNPLSRKVLLCFLFFSFLCRINLDARNKVTFLKSPLAPTSLSLNASLFFIVSSPILSPQSPPVLRPKPHILPLLCFDFSHPQTGAFCPLSLLPRPFFFLFRFRGS